MATIPKNEMKSKAVMMNPAWATELLKRNHKNNRKVKDKRVNAYAREMASGLWRLTHQAIALDEDDWLVDGQTRLHAVIIADCEVPMYMTTGVPRRSMVAVDTGANRNLADAAQIAGNPLPTQGYGPVARAMMVGLDLSRKHSGHIGHQEIMRFIRVHRDALAFAFECIPSNDRYITPAAIRAIVARAWYSPKNRTRVRQFCDAVRTGLLDNRDTDTAAIRLRNWLLNVSESRGKRTRSETYAKIEWALDKFVKGEDVAALLAAKEELFPIPQEADLAPITDEEAA